MRGDVESLNEIIKIDDYILDKVLVGTFKCKNPLHVAISTGQFEFVLELLKKKEDLVKVLDTELGSALHIASSKGYLEIVKLLVEVSPGMCLARDREGNNPLQIAAMQGKVEVLEVLLQASPYAARVNLDRGDTILHLCVNYNQLESLKLLVEKVGDKIFVNSTDTNGNSILHLAVFGKRHEIVEYVLGVSKIDVNARNRSQWTALDIHYRVNKITDRNSDSINSVLRKSKAKRRIEIFLPMERSWGKKRKDTLMIVSSLMATIAFQVGVDPPGGVWVDNAPDHVAGKAITAYNYPNAYPYFMYFNTLGLLLSLTIIYDLIAGFPSGKWLSGFTRSMISCATIMTTAFTYTFSVTVVTPTKNNEKFVNHAIWVTVIVWAVLITYCRRLVPYKLREITGRVMAWIVGALNSLPDRIGRLIEKQWNRKKTNKTTELPGLP